MDMLAGAQRDAVGDKRDVNQSIREKDGPQSARNGVADAASIIADLIQISSEAGSGAPQNPQDKGLELMRERLSQLREEMEFIKSLLAAGAGSDQARILGRQLQDIGSNLDTIGRQLGVERPLAVVVETNINVEAVSLSLRFNSVAEGRVEKTRIDIDYVRISAETTTTVVTAAGPGGLGNLPADPQIAASRDDFRVTAQSFKKLLAEFDKNFTDRDRLPLNLYNTIRAQIEAALNKGGAPHAVDSFA